MAPHTLVRRLAEVVPEYPINVGEADLPYVIFGHLALYVCDLVRHPERNADVLHRIVHVLEEMASSHDVETQNILVAGFLEVVSDDEAGVSWAASSLGPNAKSLFARYNP